jgi:hypothetical protein
MTKNAKNDEQNVIARAKRSLWGWAYAIGLMLCLTGIGRAQEAQVFSLEGKGTSYVVISTNSRTAYIVDGGLGGEKGIHNVRVNDRNGVGRPVLEHLLAQGVRTLVITNTHAHADHLGGLKTLIEKDPNLQRFERLRLVETGVGGTPLADAFARRYPRTPTGMQVESRVAARGDNLYGGLAKPGDGVIPGHFFSPQARSGLNGSVLIPEFTLQQDGRRTRVADLSDADHRVVQAWIARQKETGAKTDVVFAPHHGSKSSDLASLWQANLGIRQCVVTANLGNQYGHPHASQVFQATDKLGYGNVLVTGSGSHINITARGMDARPEDRARLARVLDHYARHHVEGRQARLEEELFAGGARGKAGDPGWTRRQEGLQREWTELARQGNRAMQLASDKPGRPPSSANQPALVPPASNPVTRFQYAPLSTEQFHKQSERFLRPPDKQGANERREQQQRGGQTPAERRTSRQEFNVTPQSVPNYGGITLGAAIRSAPKISGRATFVSFLEDGETRWCLRVKTVAGEGCYDAMTGAELWTAYNFLRPDAQLRAKHPRLEDEPGLVNCDASSRGYQCSTHPAVTGTVIGFNAIRMDVMVLAAQDLFFKSDGKKSVAETLPSPLLRMKWEQLRDFGMLLWYDESPVIRVADGQVRVEASQGPKDILLRMRWLANLKPKCDTRREKCFDDRRLDESSLRLLRDNFTPFARIDRLARTVAVLNWVWRETGELPSLPVGLEPPRRNIPNPFPLEIVF